MNKSATVCSQLAHPINVTSGLLSLRVAVLLDPPANVTVSTTTQKGELNVSWVPPSLKYMEDTMMYEVSYAAADGHSGQVRRLCLA